jgi:hypothetical protein
VSFYTSLLDAGLVDEGLVSRDTEVRNRVAVRQLMQLGIAPEVADELRDSMTT